MEQQRPYQRHHYRVPLTTQYPVMVADAETIAEGKVVDLTVLGCAIECANTLPIQTAIRVRLILPDHDHSLPVEEAEVRWVQGTRIGLQFRKLDRAADLRLHNFVWDRMLDRLRAITQEELPTS
jgi:c-di-GMP-binding flagellar brake protein YcgR